MTHKITALKLQKRNHQRVNVYLDGEFAFGLARIIAAWLHVGQELTGEKIEQLLSEDAQEVAYHKALKYIGYRPRSEAEVRRKLSKSKITEDIQNDVIQRLRECNMIDDAHFAQIWVENRCALRPRSRRMLAYELKQRGINQEIIDQTLYEINDEELAYRAAIKQARRLSTLKFEDFRKKMYGFLSRRGFNYAVCAAIVTRVWEENKEELTEKM